MGAGIAQVAATAGWTVRLIDVDVETVAAAIQGVQARLDRAVGKGRMDTAAAAETLSRLQASTITDLGDCDLFIEAIVEDLDIKASAVAPAIDVLPADAIIATNTSSLSVGDLGARLDAGDRVCGMHFFNPAPIMKLVEVVRGRETRDDVVDRVAEIASSWGKQVARCADTPGFIVNRVARPYYLEAFRCLEDGLADAASIDAAMKTIGGFRMGPFELTDFIGHDVNTATTRTVWEQWDRPARLLPSHTQEQLAAEGNLGRKTGCGVYDWSGAEPMAVLRPPQEAATGVEALSDIAARLCLAATSNAEAAKKASSSQQIAFMRVLAAVLNEAAWAASDGVADPDDIDIAMRAGVNYPKGPFEWWRSIGEDLMGEVLAALRENVQADRFSRPPEAPGDASH
jgi:3-hydroxybutyryl-CoA dehydrogenase